MNNNNNNKKKTEFKEVLVTIKCNRGTRTEGREKRRENIKRNNYWKFPKFIEKY